MEAIQQVTPKSGTMNLIRFMAQHWNEPYSFFEAKGMKRRHFYRLRQELKKYPEIENRYKPL